MKDISSLRIEYTPKSLDENGMHDNPIAEFETWFSAVLHSQIIEPNAMTLATSTLSGAPSARVVLLKEFTPQGFVFFTNYESRKGRELSKNPMAALVFDWHEVARQVRIEGCVEKITAHESDTYFASRPRSSQIGAWVSAQSSVIEGRHTLDELQSVYEKRFENSEIPRPDYWGGYLLRPTRIEFWQGNKNRLHDRIAYTAIDNGWTKHRLAP